MRAILFLLLSIVSINMSAQSWRYNRGRVYNDRNRAPINEKNRRQSTYYQELEKQLEKESQKERQRYNSNNNQLSSSVSINKTEQSSEKVISLVSNGTGKTKEEAIQNALRSAIEQTYGTFVSSNTEVLNDDMIKDEIVTVSSGNIKSYKELSVDQSDGFYDVSVQVTISIDHLTQFAQSRGMQAELAGASFVMNMRMKELNKKNEAASIEHMIEKAKAIAKNGLFDYLLEIGEPQMMRGSKYTIMLTIYFCENDNTIAFFKTLYETIQTLSLSSWEVKEYQKANIPYYVYNIQLSQSRLGKYALRNDYINTRKGYTWLMPMYMKELSNYVIKDNLGNKWNGNHENLQDANPFEGESLHFNPAESYRKVNKGIGIVLRDNKRIYYVQKFSIDYTEEELSKLTSITIENKRD